MLEELAGLLGGAAGGLGLSNDSSAASASPLYNDAGISFGGGGVGGITAGPTSADSRQSLGGNQALPDASFGSPFSSNGASGNSWLFWALGIGGGLLALLLAFKLLKGR